MYTRYLHNFQPFHSACTTNQKAMDPAKTQKLYENELSAEKEEDEDVAIIRSRALKNWKRDEVIDISSSEDDEDLDCH
ncbi:hypothetical protein QVD17_30066 [Tagetes erecta]|uniref:Uncharacterized protein n=1 Tax=Tagetes erecta TaxID=13708 RepID=A0AAD8K187_TARER|nr:hypothetical protein QVD17_30066 [Tagetes erecta]